MSRLETETKPRVAVVIVTRNRPDDLQRALESIATQDWPVLEVWVCDDGSTPPLEHSRFEALNLQLRWIRAEHSRGPTHYRGRALREVKADYLLSIDDDVYLSGSDTVRKAVWQLQQNPQLGALALPLIEPSRNPTGHAAFCRQVAELKPQLRLRSFLGGSVLFHLPAVRSIGGVRDLFLHLGGEEHDLALRLLDAGYEIGYGDTPMLVHTVSGVRNKHHKFQFDVRSAILFEFLNMPLTVVGQRMLVRSLGLLKYQGSGIAFRSRAMAVIKAWAACARHFTSRRPISRKTYRRYRQWPSHGIECTPSQWTPSVQNTHPASASVR